MPGLIIDIPLGCDRLQFCSILDLNFSAAFFCGFILRAHHAPAGSHPADQAHPDQHYPACFRQHVSLSSGFRFGFPHRDLLKSKPNAQFKNCYKSNKLEPKENRGTPSLLF
jgi:hypothetical protein